MMARAPVRQQSISLKRDAVRSPEKDAFFWRQHAFYAINDLFQASFCATRLDVCCPTFCKSMQAWPGPRRVVWHQRARLILLLILA